MAIDLSKVLSRLFSQRRWIVAYGIILFLLAAVEVGRDYFLRNIDQNWGTIRDEVDDKLAQDIEHKAASFIERLTRECNTIARDKALITLIQSPTDSGKALFLRNLISRFPTDDFSIEIRDISGNSIAYFGRPIRNRSCQGIPLDYHFETCADGPYRLLVYNRILRAANGIPIGYVSCGAPISISIPINNRFLQRGGLKEELENTFGLEILFDFSKERALSSDGRYFSFPIRSGTDVIAYGYALRTNPVTYRQKIDSQFQIVSRFLLAAFFVILTIHAISAQRRIRNAFLCVALITAQLWLLRILFLYFDVVITLLPSEILHPAYFASSFGGGLVSSIGELTITLIILFANLCFAVTILYKTPEKELNFSRSMAFIVFPAIFLVMPFMFRGYTASIRSFVLDSSFNYDDIIPLLSEPMLIVMLGDIFLLSSSLFLGFTLLYRIIRIAITNLKLQIPSFVILVIIIVTASLVVFFTVTHEVLLPPWIYFAGIAIFVLFSWYDVGSLIPRRLKLVTGFLFVSMSGAILGVFLLSHFMDERRRSDIEAIAVETARPADGWSTVLVEQALSRFAEESVQMPPTTDSLPTIDFQKAFNLWAESPLSTQPNNTAIILLTVGNQSISQFSVGLPPEILDEKSIGQMLLSHERQVRKVQYQIEGKQRNFYFGVTPIKTDNRPRSFALVILEAIDPILSTRDGVDILRNVPSKPSLAPEDHFIISSFIGNRLAQTSSTWFERIGILHSDVFSAMRRGKDRLWSVIETESGSLDTYFIKINENDSDNIIAISKGRGIFLFTLYRWLRIGFVFLVTGIALFAPYYILQRRGYRISSLSFSSILLIAFLSVAAIPVFLVWMTAKDYVSDMNLRTIEQQLSENLRDLRNNLLVYSDIRALTDKNGKVTDRICQEISAKAGKEMNIYLGSDLFATSKPELYHTSLLNSKLNPEAHLQLILLGKDFYMASEKIGDFSYFVGYTALRDASGNLAAILSTPTLFERNRAEEEYIRASAAIFLGIALIILLVILVSAALARQISRPLQTLVAATKDIAAGDLERRVEVKGARDIKELMNSFNIMTTELRLNRDRLASVERELAWKEMAKQVAHEIRNPLTPIKLAVQHLRRAYIDRAKNLGDLIVKVTDTIIDQINTLSRISDEFSRFARMPIRSIDKVDVARLLEESVTLFRHHEHITFSLVCDDDLPMLSADREELSRAFTNILRNAVQSIHDHGSITIMVTNEDSGILIKISDTGCGIEPDLLPRIFEPNFSTKTEGMGLGLPIVKKIIDDLEGTIRIESTPGTGTTVTIFLPGISS